MLATTYAGHSVFLLTAEPVGAMQIGVSRLTDIQAGKTRREERRALGATLRWKLAYPILIDDRVEAQTFRAGLRAWGSTLTAEGTTLPILCPFWLLALPYGSASLFTAGLRITWEPGFAQWALHTTGSPGFTPSAAARTAPVLWGRFDKLPDPSLLTTEAIDDNISFVETGPKDAPTAYAIAPAAGVAVHTGPVLHDVAWPLLDFDLDYSKTRGGGVEVQVDRQRLGYGRAEVETFHPQTPRRQVNCAVALSGLAEFARLIATFHAAGGTVSPIWFSSGFSPTRLTANPAAGSNALSVESVAALGGHPHLALRDAATGATVCRTIESSTGDTLLALDTAPGDFDQETISLQLLLFGRFASDELTLSGASPLDIAGQFTLTEIPADYGAPAGEIYEETIGHVGDPIFLFEIADQIGGTWFWTNYEADITIGGQLYLSKGIDWDKVTERLNLDDGKVTLTVDSWAGNPFLRLLRPRRGQQLSVVLKEWNAAGTADPVVHFRGYGSSAKPSGRVITIPLTGDGCRLVQMKIPRRLDGPNCPWTIYGPGCGLDPDAVGCGAVPTLIAPTQISLATGAARAAHFYAGGWMQRAAPGEGAPTYAVLDHPAAPDGVVTLTLDTPIDPPIGTGEWWTVYPGCDCTWETCGARGNQANFGGANRKPAANPAMVPIQQATSATSKK